MYLVVCSAVEFCETQIERVWRHSGVIRIFRCVSSLRISQQVNPLVVFFWESLSACHPGVWFPSPPSSEGGPEEEGSWPRVVSMNI